MMRLGERQRAGRPVLRDNGDLALLSRIIGARRDRTESNRLARKLLARFSDIGRVLNCEIGELETVPGVTADIAEEFATAREPACALARRRTEERPVIEDSAAVITFCRILLAHERREQFHVLYLNKDLRLIQHKCLQLGTVDHVTVYPREVLAQALLCHACSVILVHNHPSGSTLPSKADIRMTEELAKAGRYLGISVIDHIIIAAGQHFSFLEKGVMPREKKE